MTEFCIIKMEKGINFWRVFFFLRKIFERILKKGYIVGILKYCKICIGPNLHENLYTL